jgi:hypothetical protein
MKAVFGINIPTAPRNELVAPNNTLGDGVSENEVPFLMRFPHLSPTNAGNTGK